MKLCFWEFEAWDPAKEKYWLPVDLYIGGVEHAVLHLLYARFWHKVLFDLGFVSTKEPFKKLINQGMILGTDGEKMSKSRGNVVNPDDVVKEYGADSLRLYEMFMGPLDRVKPWKMTGVKGVYNFLNKAYKFFNSPDSIGGNQSDEVTKILHKTIKKVGEDIEALRFNTAISQLMIFTNTCIKNKKVTTETAEAFSILLAPFAPHAAEEIWETLGNKKTLTYEPWPNYKAELAKDDLITVGVQINGKTRATIEVASDISKENFLAHAKDNDQIQKYLQDVSIIKEIYIPGRICNFVVKPN